MRKFLLNIVLWTWCLPQTILGLIYLVFLRNKIIKKQNHKGIALYSVRVNGLFGGVSLGKFIFINNKLFNKKTIRHEYGHTLQGYIFGPLFLLIISLPSAILFWVSKYNKNVKKNYFSYFPENWADKLGGVGKYKTS